MATSLFVLLKEYADESNAPSSAYIRGDDQLDYNRFKAYFGELIDMMLFFKYEVCHRYFDMNNIKQALYPFSILDAYDSEQDVWYPFDDTVVLSQLYQLGFVDWNEEFDGQSVDCTFNEHIVKDDMLGAMVWLISRDNPAVLVDKGALCQGERIEVRVAYNPSVHIDVVTDVSGLHRWFSANRNPQRTYIYSDKHGNCFKKSQFISGTSRRAAQLDCTDAEAQLLLERAVGSDPASELWFYDEQRGKFIYFENQNELRLAFHGYHLLPGEDNFENIDIDKLDMIQILPSKRRWKQ